MKWSDLFMVNLHQGVRGRWSYCAYRDATSVFISNRSVGTVFECIEEIDEAIRREGGASGGRVRKTAEGEGAESPGQPKGVTRSRPAGRAEGEPKRAVPVPGVVEIHEVVPGTARQRRLESRRQRKKR